MTGAAIPVSAGWLALREPADAAARSAELVDLLPPAGSWEIHDLAGGTGSMGRWLAPRLTGAQRWVIHDWDEDLLRAAAADPPAAPVVWEPRRSDITRLEPEQLAGADLITASAVIDLMTADQLHELIRVCVPARCPVLLSLAVTGRVHLEPADLLDRRVEAAFNAHQRRTTGAGRLLGPDAVGAAVEEFQLQGREALVRPSPWRLGRDESALAAVWFQGWIGAAMAQDPGLATEAEGYARRREAEARAGRLRVTVGHSDVVVLP